MFSYSTLTNRQDLGLIATNRDARPARAYSEQIRKPAAASHHPNDPHSLWPAGGQPPEASTLRGLIMLMSVAIGSIGGIVYMIVDA